MQNMISSPNDMQKLTKSNVIQNSNYIFLFSISASGLDKLLSALEIWTRRSKHTIRCSISLPFEEKEFLETANRKLVERLPHLDCNIHLSQSFLKYEQRWIKELLFAPLEDENMEWFIYCDMDTFFFIENLERLLRRYDASQMHFLGGISDDRRTLSKYSHYAFGGAGIIVSRALALPLCKILQTHALILSDGIHGGDHLLHLIITKELGVSLTVIPELHQIDFRGNINGLLESSLYTRDMITLHHLGTFSLKSLN